MSSQELRKLGRYELVRVLGRGAMGLVYEARDPNLERRVAIKTIKVENLADDAAAEYEARFRTEARSAARLQHPNIVSVYDSGRDGDIAYLVMEFVQGEDLKHHLDAGTRFSLAQSCALVADLLAALAYAHSQAIVHRDVKPANLLIEANGRVKLADFGVARIQDTGDATRTRGSMVGTLKYMSPEQVQGQRVDARADLFATGVVLYQLLTGTRPFEGDTDFAIIQHIVASEPAPPSSISPRCPAALDAVLARALAKARDDRFASAQDFAVALQEASGLAADHTIVPPFAVSQAGVGSDSRPTQGSGSTAVFGPGPGTEPGSTMTQELELVYWKDVRDSEDTEDVQGFLVRFPNGIYADLARRRLRKLSGQGTGTGTGSLSGTEATRMDGSTLYLGQPTPPEPTRVDGVVASGVTVPVSEGTVAEVSAAADVDSTAEAAASGPVSEPEPTLAQAAAAPALPAAVPGPASVAPRRSGKKPLWIGVAAAVLLAVGVFSMRSTPGSDGAPAAEGPTPPPLIAAPQPSAGVSTGTAVVQPTPVHASTSAARSDPPAVAASAGVANAGDGARAPKSPASRPMASPARTTATAAGAPASAAATATLAAKPETRPAPQPAAPITTAPAAPAALGSPADACKGRVLLGYQSCMNDQCSLPAFTNHAVCVERRAQEKARRDAQNNRS